MTHKNQILTILLLTAMLLTVFFVSCEKRPLDIRIESVKRPELPRVNIDLVELSEADIMEMNTAIFRGEITAVEHIQVNMGGTPILFGRITVMPNQVIRGTGLQKADEEITILLPLGYAYSEYTEAGAEGIFMVKLYDKSSRYEENGVSVTLLDLADGGLYDGERFCFLETENGTAAMSELWQNGTLETFPADATIDDVGTYFETLLAHGTRK